MGLQRVRHGQSNFHFQFLIGGSVVKNPSADAGDTGETGSIPGSARLPGEGNGMATHPRILAWEIPWTEEGYSP